MVFRTIGIYVITSTFFYVFFTFFQNPKSIYLTFYVFLPCFVRFLELWMRSRVTVLSESDEESLADAKVSARQQCV